MHALQEAAIFGFYLLIPLVFGICAGNFLSNAVKFTPSGGKLDLELQCEEVVESKDMELLALSSSPSTPTCSSEGTLLGATGIQILTKTSSQGKDCQGKVARLRLSVKDNGIGKFKYLKMCELLHVSY